LFTSAVSNRSPREIPMLRHKIERAVAHFALDPASHDGKAVVHVLETYPRDELFQASVTDLIRTVRGIPAEAEHYEGRKARAIALGICIASVAVAGVFLLGVLRQSYWALALPVAGAVRSLAAMVFWIGWAIVTQRSTLEQFESAPAHQFLAGDLRRHHDVFQCRQRRHQLKALKDETDGLITDTR